LYKTLGVENDANTGEIREAYLAIAREYHPDRCPDALEYFTHAAKAYETLSDNQKRAVYDDDMMSDSEFFSVAAGNRKINLMYVFGSLGIASMGYIAYLQMFKTSDEGKCPIDHKKR
jgi:DnaJ-class molecular chaperone